MSVYGVSLTKDEADIVEASTRHMLTHCDRVLIVDHESSDATPIILHDLAAEYGGRLVVDTYSGPFEQEELVNDLARRVCDNGATWVVPFDTDELWQGEPLRERLPNCDGDSVSAVVFQHAGLEVTAADPLSQMEWRYTVPWSWPKAAARAGIPFSVGHHEARGAHLSHEMFEVRHFPWRTPAQARARVQRNVTGVATPELRKEYAGLAALLFEQGVFDEWWSGLCATDGCVRDPAEVRA